MVIRTNKSTEDNKRGTQSLTDEFLCIDEKYECKEWFKKASDMMLHIESGKCVAYEAEEMEKTFQQDDMSRETLKFYNRQRRHFTCPVCRGSKFKDMTTLMLHAEGNSCSIHPMKGSLHEALCEIPDAGMESEYGCDCCW